jgi:hypothetical protein
LSYATCSPSDIALMTVRLPPWSGSAAAGD